MGFQEALRSFQFRPRRSFWRRRNCSTDLVRRAFGLGSDNDVTAGSRTQSHHRKALTRKYIDRDRNRRSVVPVRWDRSPGFRCKKIVDSQSRRL